MIDHSTFQVWSSIVWISYKKCYYFSVISFPKEIYVVKRRIVHIKNLLKWQCLHFKALCYIKQWQFCLPYFHIPQYLSRFFTFFIFSTKCTKSVLLISFRLSSKIDKCWCQELYCFAFQHYSCWLDNVLTSSWYACDI